MISRMSSIASVSSQSRTCGSVRASSQVPTGDLPIIAVQLPALPRRVLMIPSTDAAAPPTLPALPCSAKRRYSTGTSGEQHLLYLQIVNIGREVGALGGEADNHRAVGLIGVVEIVPRVGELVAEAEQTVGADCWPH